MRPIVCEPPRNEIFNGLRQIWKRESGRNYGELAEILSKYLELSISPQRLSSWATGSDDRKAPWEAIYWLMHVTGYRVVLGTENVKLQKPRKKK